MSKTQVPMKWCDKATAKVIELHRLNVEAKDVEENSKEALTAIGKAVAEHVGHTGKIPTFHGVRAKLSSAGEYTPKQAATKPKGGTVIAKASIVETLKEKMGIDLDVGTLTNANRADLEAVVKQATVMNELLIHNATREQLEVALENLQDAEIDAIAGGVDVADIAEAEALAGEAVEAAENLTE